MSLVEPRISSPTKFNHKAMRPFFAYLPVNRIKATFKHTTQLMKMPSPTYLRERHQTPHSAANIVCQRETDFGDVIYFDVPAIDGDITAAQLWTGQHTNFTTVHDVKNESKSSLLSTFQDRV